MAHGKVLLQGTAAEVRSNRHVLDAYLGEISA
jgi:ABC-type branched-subunit amino acid transport system ATPase component